MGGDDGRERDGLRLEAGSDDSYFERRMLATLSRALEILAEMTVARGREPSREEIRDAVDEGVSSELCAAVLDVIGKDISVFDVKFNWAPASSAPMQLADRVVFDSQSAELIERVGSHLKEADAPAERVLYGVIRRLSLKKGETSGHVALETVIDGKARIVNFELPLEIYRRAARYHGERRPVVVRGILDATPGRRAIMDVTAFEADRSIVSFDDIQR